MPTPVIELTFQNTYAGRFPGERGIRTRTILRFTDKNGQIARLSEKINKNREEKVKEYSQTRIGANPSIPLFSMRFWYFYFIDRRYKRAKYTLIEKLSRRVERLLEREPASIGLLVAHNSTFDGFLPVLERYKAKQLAYLLDGANDMWCRVLEPS